jgi:hypothetical protein
LRSVAILAALFALGSRFAGKIVTTTLGWASTLLFGRVPASRQFLLLGITFGSVIWMALVAGVLFPNVGTFLLVLIPQQSIVPEWVIRLVMLLGALVVPGVVGLLVLALSPPAERQGKRAVSSVLRGYPLTVLLAVLLVFLALLAIWRKARSAARRWTDAHVPMVVKPGAYDQVADDLDRAVTAAGLDVTPTEAPAAMSRPARWLAAVAGTGSAALVPDRMIQLHGQDLDILIYPMDLLISGTAVNVARARAAMASRLTTSAAHLTVSAEAQAIEDRLMTLARPRTTEPAPPRFDDAAAAEFEAIDGVLASIQIPYDEWEVLYRQRLQVERDLRAGAMAEDAVLGANGAATGEGVRAGLSAIGRLARTGAGIAVDVATDDRTGQVLDRMAGPQWRWAIRAASVAAIAAREALRAPGARDPDDSIVGERNAGEPSRFPDDPAANDRHEGAGERDRKGNDEAGVGEGREREAVRSAARGRARGR